MVVGCVVGAGYRHTLTRELVVLPLHRADFDKAIGVGGTKVHVPADGSIPKELQCALNEGSLIMDAVMLPCCQTNVSHKAVLPRLLDNASCPICMQPDVTQDMLQENKKLRDTVRSFLRTAKEKGITIKGMAPPVPAPTEAKPVAEAQKAKDENAEGDRVSPVGDSADGGEGEARGDVAG